MTSLTGRSSALATASRFSRTRRVDVNVRRRLTADRELLHVRVRRVQQTAALGDRHNGDRVRQPVGDEVRTLDRVNGDIDLGAARPDLLADEQHRCFVAFAFADDDAAGDLHLAERVAHLLDGRAVGRVALASTHPARSRQRGALGHLHEIERVNRMVQYRSHHRAWHRLEPTREAPYFLLNTLRRVRRQPISQPLPSRPWRVGALLLAGWPAVFAVALAGATLGFFAWYAIVVPHHNAAESQLGLTLAPLAGAAAAIAAWIGYARYFSGRARITLERSLQYDAPTYLPFLLLWLTFISPAQAAHEARLFLLAAALFCIGKVLIAARFNQTVREVLVDFALTRVAIIVIAELAAMIIGQRAGTHVQESSHMLLAVWGRWDAVHYLDIATHRLPRHRHGFLPALSRCSSASSERWWATISLRAC